eukprot:TRINITY_DN7520_c0_g1_i1.p1 TRINITY_DN7520_c0_g1~~TRINITY_DN7520_c0_g1_i1.p1  ORF type:complete len:586 (+),score=79.65 TRINITY_DN7520_c0_g1_i1:99-1760(+)
MAALANLKATVWKASPVEDHSTFRYHIQLHLGDTKWEVTKRFSEFDTLLQSLAASQYAGLPSLPSKTLLGSPTDTAAIEGRKEQLRIILLDLVARPDTRTSQPLRQFLAVDSHSPAAIKSVKPDAMRTFEDPRFGVSGIATAPSSNLLAITQEDSTHLSRLGRVWSVVEADELGALHIWGLGADSAWKRSFSRTYSIKVRSLCYEEVTRQMFVGLEDGKIEIYAISDALKPTQVAVLELHHKSPVTYLTASSKRLFSLGFDTAMRTVDVRTRELLCGGRLLKRLKSELDYLTTGYLDDERDRAFVGTSGGDVFILDIARNPPSFLHTVELGSKPVSSITVNKETLLIAHCECISVLSFEGKGLERRITRIGSHKAKHLTAGEVTLLSVAVASERNFVFGGYSDGSVAIWNTHESEAFVVMQAHPNDTTQLVWVEAAPWGPALMSGGGDGKVITWSLSLNSDDYQSLSAQNDDSVPGFPSLGDFGFTSPTVTNGVNSDALSAFDPSFGSSAPIASTFNSGGVGEMSSNPRVNPQALKREGESDSDDDNIADAFH